MAKEHCCESGLPITMQIGDLEPQVIAHVEHNEGEPVEQFQARLAAVLLSVAISVLAPPEES